MDFFVNELSIHRQFHDMPSFRAALDRLMSMRNLVGRFNCDMFCHRAILNAEVMPGVSMPRAIGRLPEAERRAAMFWLTRGGPFWDDLRQHRGNEYLECNDLIVTDTGIGEAAYRNIHGVISSLISALPTDWNYSPVEVIWRREAEEMEDQRAVVDNWWELNELEMSLDKIAPPIATWRDLHGVSSSRFAKLVFADDWLDPLDGTQFVRSSADRIIFLLAILNRFAHAFDANGVRTREGQRIYQDYFTGNNAHFSDSSDREKSRFKKDLTFSHPTETGRFLFGTWHGKERRLTLRLHYSWTRRADDPVYILYLGPKITRR